MFGDPSICIDAQEGAEKRKRGRPSNKSKFLAKQGDLFRTQQYLQFVAAAQEAPAAAPAARQREDGSGERLLGKPIRIW